MKWIAPTLTYLAVAVGLFGFQSAWGALVGFHLAILLSLLIAKPNLSIRILFRGRNLKWILVSILLCASSGLTLYFFWDKLGIAEDVSARVGALGLNTSNWIAFIAYFTLVNPLLEEYFWRGYLGSVNPTPHISDVLYSGFHGLILINKVQPGVIVCCLTVLMLAGWFWRQLARTNGGLLAPLLGHMIADLTILVAIFLKV